MPLRDCRPSKSRPPSSAASLPGTPGRPRAHGAHRAGRQAYPAIVTAQAQPTTPGDFREPFVGHLPGYRAESERCAPGPPSESSYNELLTDRWRALLDSSESRGEALIHAFLERHPSLLPGSHSVDGDSGHSPFPMAVISKPKLPGLSDREPDFMWIATDSGSVYPILIEIETPHKRWFYGKRAGWRGRWRPFVRSYGLLALGSEAAYFVP